MVHKHSLREEIDRVETTCPPRLFLQPSEFSATVDRDCLLPASFGVIFVVAEGWYCGSEA